ASEDLFRDVPAILGFGFLLLRATCRIGGCFRALHRRVGDVESRVAVIVDRHGPEYLGIAEAPALEALGARRSPGLKRIRHEEIGCVAEIERLAFRPARADIAVGRLLHFFAAREEEVVASLALRGRAVRPRN